jgi:hypothetical protein
MVLRSAFGRASVLDGGPEDELKKLLLPRVTFRGGRGGPRWLGGLQVLQLALLLLAGHGMMVREDPGFEQSRDPPRRLAAPERPRADSRFVPTVSSRAGAGCRRTRM